MPSKYKPTRDRKQHQTPKKFNATRLEELANIPSAGNASPENPNADTIIPLTKAEKEEKRRVELRGEIQEGQPKMSSKKQKRLNKYIVRLFLKTLCKAIELILWYAIGKQTQEGGANGLDAEIIRDQG